MSKSSHKDIARAISNLSGNLSSARLSRALASYLARERRTSELDAIMRELTRQRAQDGVLEANVTSAFPLSDSVKRELRKLAGNDKLVLNETIDKTVIGGVRMETSEAMLDLTVRNRLNTLKQGVVKTQ